MSWSHSLLGGGEEFFDESGRLVAASLHTDYGAYCGGRSFTQTFGQPPRCRSTRTTTALCGRDGV